LKDYCSLLNNQLPQNQHPLIENTIREIESNNYKKIPAVSIYLTVVNMLQELNGDNYYTDLKQLLTEHKNILPKEELKDLYTILINYCNKKAQLNNEDRLKELFIWNKSIYEKGLHENRPQHIKNIVTIGLKVGEYDWTKKVIEEQKENKQLLFSDLLYDFNISAFYLYKGNYEKALKHLKNIEQFKIVQIMNHRDLLISIILDYKSLFIRLLYYMDEIISKTKTIVFIDFYLAFNRFLQFHKADLSDDFFRYKNFIDNTNQLYSCKENIGYDSKKKSIMQVHMIEKEINDTNLLHHQNWLLEKLKELKTRLKMDILT